jgi:glycerol 2-dehydrogenase (NADP+)
VPATNQVELHPCLPLQELQGLCASKGIVITAYSPLGRARPPFCCRSLTPWLILGQPKDGQPSPFMTDDVVTSIAKRLDAAPAQVVLSWAVGHRIVVVPKSENNERMQANIAVRLHLLLRRSDDH